MRKNIGYVIVWIIIIYLFSKDSSSSLHTKQIIENIEQFIPFHFSVPQLNYIIRKGAHILEFFILSYLLYSVFKRLNIHKMHMILLTGLFSLNVAFFDEIHQLHVLGRTGRIKDVGFDFMGICLSLLFICAKKRSGKVISCL